MRCVSGLLVCGLWLVLSRAAGAEDIAFNRDVRPILSDKCFACHGPDSARREAGLRLDRREQAITELDSGATAIVPGQLARSEVWRRITATDPDLVMPPPDAKLGRLAPQEVEVLRQWIESGAEYQAHWAFLPIEARVPAQVGELLHPLDAIVSRGLAERGLQLQPEADRHTLIRRVSFDLTGLPPSPEDIQNFVADTRPDAYERFVDRLLESPAYGERMAADWLDVARYADSFGFQVDRPREMWPWRDWVIRAFNSNLPWNEFVTWQIAGDLLPNATDDQRLATAFCRLHQMESEGGSVEEEYRVNSVNDRVVTFGTAFLGLTLECSRCHDHKFDPITQREYYQLFAFFDDIDEAGLYSFFTNSAPTPAMWLLSETEKEQHAQAIAAIAAEQRKLTEIAQSADDRFRAWLETSPQLDTSVPGELAHFSFEARNAEGKFVSNVGETITASSPGQNELLPGVVGQGLKLTGDHPVTTNLGNFQRDEPFSVSLWLQTPDNKDRAVIFHRSRAWTDAASRGYELLLIDGRLQWSLIHFWPGDAISVATQAKLPIGRWVHVTVTSDGSSSAAGLNIYIDGVPAPLEIVRNHLTRNITGGGGDQIVIGERFRDRGFKGGLVDEFRVFGRELTSLEVADVHESGTLSSLLLKSTAGLTTAEHQALRGVYLSRYDAPYREQLAALQAARRRQTELAEKPREIMVMQEMAAPKTAYILQRGEYNQRGEAVTPGTPAALPPFPADQPRNRLGLARWLTDPQHPLLARVTVNRVWQMAFGLGLVKTAEDFGSQSQRPVYPEVLDWLARDFIDHGWDLKRLWKTVVLSQTYRQRSAADPQVMADDPENLWLARGPRHRLPAEMIRDNALAVSGLLVTNVGGPPVPTYDLAESFKPMPAGKGEALYRRSLYTFWRRSGPGPVLEAFDVPTRQVCVARRETTNTPLHALVLLNGPQFIEAARGLAETLWTNQQGDREAVLIQGFFRLTSRLPDDAERQILSRMLAQQQAWYAAHPESAAQYLQIGERKAATEIPAVELAALTNVLNAIMNFDGCAVKR